MKKNFWIAGKQAVLESIKNPNRNVLKVIGSLNSDLENICNSKNISFEQISVSKIKKFLNSESVNHQNHLALIEELDLITVKDLLKNNSVESIIILDGVTDTRNIGSIIRSCVCFGIDAVIVDQRIFRRNNIHLYKAASGAMEYMNIIEVSNIKNAISELKKNSFFIYGMDANASTDISKISWPKKTVFVFGSEDEGLKFSIKNECDYLIKIQNNSKIDSMNVSNACSSTLAIYNYIKKRPE